MAHARLHDGHHTAAGRQVGRSAVIALRVSARACGVRLLCQRVIEAAGVAVIGEHRLVYACVAVNDLVWRIDVRCRYAWW